MMTRFALLFAALMFALPALAGDVSFEWSKASGKVDHYTVEMATDSGAGMGAYAVVAASVAPGTAANVVSPAIPLADTVESLQVRVQAFGKTATVFGPKTESLVIGVPPGAPGAITIIFVQP